MSVIDGVKTRDQGNVQGSRVADLAPALGDFMLLDVRHERDEVFERVKNVGGGYKWGGGQEKAGH